MNITRCIILYYNITLARTYVQPLRAHIKQIKQQLKKILKRTLSIIAYTRNITSKANLLVLLGSPMEHEDLLDMITDGLNEEYQAVINMVNGEDTPISIEELHEKLLHRENALASIEAPTSAFLPATANVAEYRPPYQNQNPARGVYRGSSHGGYIGGYQGKCQICRVYRHSAKRCNQLQNSQQHQYRGTSPHYNHPSSTSGTLHDIITTSIGPLATGQWSIVSHTF